MDGPTMKLNFDNTRLVMKFSLKDSSNHIFQISQLSKKQRARWNSTVAYA